MKTRTAFFCLFISICGPAAMVCAQQAVTSATLSGRVEDANGARSLARPSPQSISIKIGVQPRRATRRVVFACFICRSVTTG
ncbi:MAG: hypothetical protein J2P21_12795 [Chloracidobacterium sp.]|nr:hypothetical protein [Chloracidobacterium sp.]